MRSDKKCHAHDTHAGKHCINCQIALCHRCDRYDINGRPWCASCGVEEVPGASAAVGGLALMFAKLAAVGIPGLLTFLFLPGLILRLVGTVVVMTVIAKFVFVRDTIGPTRIEEFRDGSMVKSY